MTTPTSANVGMEVTDITDESLIASGPIIDSSSVGQHPEYVPPLIVRPLDLVSATPWFAGSVARQLKRSWNGSLLRCRRASDNAESDFGLTSNRVLDTAAITDFCGGGDGFMPTLYDQSGSENNLTQTTLLDQPFLVDGLVLQDQDTLKPRVQFANYYLRLDDGLQTQPTSLIMAVTPISHVGGSVYTDGGSGSPGQAIRQSNTATRLELYADVAATSSDNVALSTRHLIAVRFNGSSSTLQIDNNSEESGLVTGSQAPLGLTIGANGEGGTRASFYLHELIYFSSSISTADMNALRNGMNAYYEIW